MKKILIALILLGVTGCQTSDEEIRADIAGKAQHDLNFSGLQYTVRNGMVYFTGRCPSATALAKIRQTIQNIHVIKGARYHVNISPVTLDTLTPVKLKIDSLLARYPQTTANLVPGKIILKGPVKRCSKKLIEQLQKYQHGELIDSLTNINKPIN